MVAGLKGGGPGGEARAVEAVHSQPVFRTPVMARAESQSGRVAERWAPEGQAAASAPAMRSLGFADRVIVNYLGEQGGVPGGGTRRGRAVERQVAPMDWLFPIPWYLDELDWVSAARAAAWESERAAVRSGEVAARPRAADARREAAARPDVRFEARAEVRPEVRFDLPLELVAPALAAARAGERSGGARASSSSAAAAARQAAAPAAWRAYSPMVDPAAARAAELLAELVATSRQGARISPETAEMEESAAYRPAPILEYVAPSELTGSPGSPGSIDDAQRARVASAARLTIEEAQQARAAAAAQAQATSQAQAAAMAQTQVTAQAQAVARARDEAEAAARAEALAGGADAARAAEQARAAGARAAALEATRVEQAAAEQAAQQAAAEQAGKIDAERAADISREEAARQGAIEGERARREAVRGAEEARVADLARHELSRGDAARVQAARIESAQRDIARAEAARAASQQSAAHGSAAAARRAVELLAMSALAGGDLTAPSSGPRVVMPAGLGGLVAASHMSRAVHEPLSGAAPARRGRAGRASRGGSFASRPAALDHLLWSDRWLARFAGATSGALDSFDMARVSVSMRAGVATDWQPAWLSPTPGRRGSGASAMAETAGRAAPARILTAPVLDDDQPVSDDVLGAIAAAAASERHRRQRPSKVRRAGPAEPMGPFRLPAADRALARVAMPRAAGLGPSLGASPIAALLANLLDSPAQPTFDARPLSSRSVSDFLARGAAPARPSTPLAVQLARRAPGSIWLSMPSAGPAPWRSIAASATSAAASPFAAALPARTATGATAALGGRPALSLVAPGADPTSLATSSSASAGAVATQLATAGDAITARGGRGGLAAGLLSGSLGAARPGSIGGEAESFARRRSLAVADLSLDFLSPEVLVAARSFGFGPIDAVRAQRLAASGRPEMARLASMVDQVFVAALAPGQTAAAEERTAIAGRAATGELAGIAPHRTPRGSFLVPAASSRALGVTPAQAEQARPGIGAALDLVAAGQVAEVAAQQRSAAGTPGGGFGFASGAGESAAGDLDLSDPVVRARLAARRSEAAALERGATDAARAMLPPHLWSVFDAVYLSLGEETTASDVRPLAPAARAARALSLASRARGPEDLPISARARAAAAWAVLPIVLTGGASASASARGVARAAAGAVRGSSLPGTHVLVDGPFAPQAAERDVPHRPAATRAGTALATLVAPSFFRADERGDGYAPISAERARAAMSTTYVETGSASRPAPAPRPAPPTSSPRPAPAQAAAPSSAQLETWFKDAAKKYFGEAPSQSGLTVAEMTLVASAPRAQIAASEMTASRPTQNAAAAAPAAATNAPPGGAGATKPDIDKIAQDVYDQIVRMLSVARERNGDPWSR